MILSCMLNSDQIFKFVSHLIKNHRKVLPRGHREEQQFMMVSSNLQCIAKGTLTQDCTLPDHPSSQNLEGIRSFACVPIASSEQPLYTFREALQLLAYLSLQLN